MIIQKTLREWLRTTDVLLGDLRDGIAFSDEEVFVLRSYLLRLNSTMAVQGSKRSSRTDGDASTSSSEPSDPMGRPKRPSSEADATEAPDA